MSVVATPPSLPHQPYSEADMFRNSLASSGADTLDSPSPRPQQTEDRQVLHPFPVFQHRHTTPFPASTHSFSALGPGEVAPRPSTVLGSTTPPAAPQPSTVGLPGVTPDSSSEMIAETLPPTPDLPLGHTIFFPHSMVKLAPPADEKYDLQPTPPRPASVPEDDDTTDPGRPPALQVEPRTEPIVSTSGPSRVRAKTTSAGVPDERASLISPRTKSSGPARRDIRRSQTSAVVPSSARMTESRSDSRNRSRPSKIRSTSGKLLAFGRDSPNFPRTFTAPESSASTPPRSSLNLRESSPPDMGGPDGLEAKVVLLGSQGVGKTSLILRYTKGVFTSVPAAATIGSSLHARKLVHDGVRVKLQIWDTAGQERFRSMAPIYYRGAHVCVLVYDVGDRQSFEDVRSWLEELGKTVPKETVIYIVGSKIDLDATRRRAVYPHDARATIKSWMEPPAPAPLLSAPVQKSTFAHDYLSLPGSRSLFRTPSTASRAGTPKAESKPSPPTRSHSHSALSSLTAQSPTIPPPRASLDLVPARKSSRERPFSASPTSPPLRPTPILQITTDVDPESTAPRRRRISFPALQSPTAAATVTFNENVVTTATLQSPPHSRHGTSGGRFSISGLPSLTGAFGYGRSAQVGGAAFNLARLAEEHPRTPKSDTLIEPPVATVFSSRSQSFGGETPSPRLRTESSPMLDNRRRSEDWSSRSWRMGEGPSAAEALGEFGDVVKRKQSGDLLQASKSLNSLSKGRARGISLGNDSRVYPEYEDESDQDEDWGVDVAGMRVGEVSALTGEGVDALFSSISALLVRRRDKIERERTLRKKNSVMLTDPNADAKTKSTSRSCCV